MLEMSYIREHQDEIRNVIERRHVKVDLDGLLQVDEQRRSSIQQVDMLRAKRNSLSEQIAKMSADERQETVSQVKSIKVELENLESGLTELEASYQALVRDVPNLLSPEVPSGKSDADNVEVRRWGTIPKFSFAPKDHVALGEALELIDFDRAAKVAGSKFYFLKNEAVLLELALKQYAINLLVAEGFSPIKTPVLATKTVLDGTGYNPRGAETQIYSIENSDLAMIATSEISIGGYFSGEVLPAASLPAKFAGISECYRTEAGNYGRFSKGLYRVHHFDKVEMFIYALPEQSEAMHQYILSIEEKVFQGLEIPYRVVAICDGDMGAVAYRKYDVEAWMPGRGEQGDFGEVTSCSNCTDYQARRLNVKYRTPDGKTALVHTLNGTAIAISRGLIALLENHQTEDGNIRIPQALRQYLGGRELLIQK